MLKQVDEYEEVERDGWLWGEARKGHQARKPETITVISHGRRK